MPDVVHKQRYKLGRLTYEIDYDARICTSIWPHGDRLVATPDRSTEGIARARSLEYIGSDESVAWQCCQDHDLFHHILMRALGEQWSDLLYQQTRGRQSSCWILTADQEERIVLMMQRFRRTAIADHVDDALWYDGVAWRPNRIGTT